LRQFAYVGAAGVLGVLTWLVPMAIEQPGGLSSLRRENTAMWVNSAHFTSPFFGASPFMVSGTRWRVIGWGGGALVPLLPLFVLGVAALLVPLHSRFGRDKTEMPALPRPKAGKVVALALLVAVPQVLSATFLHFGKAGYALGWHGALTLLALMPAAAAASRRGVLRVGASVLVGLTSLLGARQFLVGEGMLPIRVTDVVGVYAHGANEAPFRATLGEIRRVDRDIASYKLTPDFNPARTVFVFAGADAIRYRQLCYLEPDLRLHYLTDGYDWTASYKRVQHFERDRVVEVPAGWTIVVPAAPKDELDRLTAAGQAEAVELRSGGVVWVIQPGATLAGVRLG
jgi:hypothetical protein